MPKRQIILMRPPENPGDPLEPIGTRREVAGALARFNTASDGKKRSTGTEPFFGPGFTIEIPEGLSEITQAMATIDEADIAWPVLSRICRETGWKMVDPESGRSFG